MKEAVLLRDVDVDAPGCGRLCGGRVSQLVAVSFPKLLSQILGLLVLEAGLDRGDKTNHANGSEAVAAPVMALYDVYDKFLFVCFQEARTALSLPNGVRPVDLLCQGL